jgi:hypothetical protein
VIALLNSLDEKTFYNLLSSTDPMKKTCVLSCFLIILLIGTSQATAIFSSSYSLEGVLNANTVAFFLGKTSISGNSTGYPMERIIDSPLVQDMNAYPLIGTVTIPNLDSVILVENIDLAMVASLDQLLQVYTDHITEFSDVTVMTEQGMSLLGIQNGTMQVASEIPYGVSTFLPIEVTPGFSTRFFFAATLVPVTLHCTGDYTVLTGLSDASTLRIIDGNGEVRWSGASTNTYLVFQNDAFTVIQQPPILMFPLRTSTATSPLIVSLTPATPPDVTLKQLIANVTDISQNLETENITHVVEDIGTLKEFLSSTALVANGAVILLNTTDAVTIDHTGQRFSNGGFARFNTLEITSTGTLGGPTVQGECSLIYLGKYFYNPQAKHSPTGTAIPVALIILWIVALSVFLSVHFFIRPKVNEKKTKGVKRYMLIGEIILLLLGILLLDSEVGSQFGTSAITSLFTTGISLITGVFILVELIVWVLGFFLLGLPVQIVVNAVLRYLGIGKKGNGIGRGIGYLSVWVFCGLYLILILNTILSFIHVNVLAPLG